MPNPLLFAKAEGKAATTWHGRHGSSPQDAPRGQSRCRGRCQHRAPSTHEEPDDLGGAATAQVRVVQGAAGAFGLQTAPLRGRDAPSRRDERGERGESTTGAAAEWWRREMGFQGLWMRCSLTRNLDFSK